MDAVDAFIEKEDFINNPHVLGVIVCGSQITGYAHERSDVDIQVIYDNTLKDMERGTVELLGYRVEYFKKSIGMVFSQVNNGYINRCNAYLTMIGNGKVVYNRIIEDETRGIIVNPIQNLINYIKKIYSKPLPKLSHDDSIEMAAIISNKLEKLKARVDKMDTISIIEFYAYYYHVLEKIREFYSSRLGCPDIPRDKVRRIYKDSKYREAYCKSEIPEEEFILKYFKAFYGFGFRKRKMKLITGLYDYSIQGLGFDPKKYRAKIKDRYSILCPTHKS